MDNKEKKLLNPDSIKFMPSTKDALIKACQQEDRTKSYITERALREDLKSRGYLKN
jgi:hypothetical protein